MISQDVSLNSNILKKGFLISTGVDSVLSEIFEPHIIRFFCEFKINTPRRINFALATILHECNYFKNLKEIKPFEKYGNFYGRGCVQLTWLKNYKDFRFWLESKGYKYNVVAEPDLVSDVPALSVLAFCFYAEQNDLNELADQNRFVDYQAKVNAGHEASKRINNIEDRINILIKLEAWNK